MRSIHWQISAVVLAGMVVAMPVRGQKSGGDTFDSIEPSKVLDLKELPLGITILQISALQLTDGKVKKQFNDELGKMTSEIKAAVGGKKLGFLLKVELYSDEHGTPVVPSGQLIFPIGAGTEPADSLAEFTRRPRLEGNKPAGFNNDSYYLWVKANGDKLEASAIPREFRERLEKLARDEAERRNLLGEWERALPPEGFKSIQRAEYWSDVSAKYSKLLAEKEDRDKVAAIVKQFEEAQAKFNEAYKAYQEAERDMARQQNFSNMLRFASTVVGVLSTADKLGAFKSSGAGATPVRTDAKPQSNLGATMEYSRKRFNAISGTYEEERIRIKLQSDELGKLDSSLRDLFKRDGIPIPRADEPYMFPRP
jgi:hypothetical protein